MWKWTKPDDIKLIILDGDTLEADFLNHQYITNNRIIETVVVTRNNGLMHDKNIINYFDFYDLIQEIISTYKVESYTIISISKDIFFLKSMMEYHIGTVLIGKFKSDFLKNIPDYTVQHMKSVDEIIAYHRKGYAAEVIASYNTPKKTMSLLRCSEEIVLNDKKRKNVDLYFGGRYYALKHMYILNDALSQTVREFKYHHVDAVDLFFDLACCFIAKIEDIDCFTYVPLKPADIKTKRFDRFKSLNLLELKKRKKNLETMLLCTQDFSQKGNEYHVRKEVVKGVFEVIDDVNNKTIVIIDDVFTSGSTILEASKTLYEAGAKKVIAIILSVNQLTESSIGFKNLKCNICGDEMVLKMRKSDGLLFYGCKNYKNHEYNKSSSIDFLNGMDKSKEINKLEVVDIVDLEDVF